MIDFSDFVSSPKKNRKQGKSEEDEVEYLGTKGRKKRRVIEIDDDVGDDDEIKYLGSISAEEAAPGEELSHFSFDCARGGCEKCYCFVCDVPRSKCTEWAGKHELVRDDDNGRVLRKRAKLKGVPSSSISTTKIRSFGSSHKRPTIKHCVCNCDLCVPIATWWKARETNELKINQTNWQLRAHLMDTLDRSSYSVSYSLQVKSAIVSLIITRHTGKEAQKKHDSFSRAVPEKDRPPLISQASKATTANHKRPPLSSAAASHHRQKRIAKHPIRTPAAAAPPHNTSTKQRKLPSASATASSRPSSSALLSTLDKVPSRSPIKRITPLGLLNKKPTAAVSSSSQKEDPSTSKRKR